MMVESSTLHIYQAGFCLFLLHCLQLVLYYCNQTQNQSMLTANMTFAYGRLKGKIIQISLAWNKKEKYCEWFLQAYSLLNWFFSSILP